MYLLYTILIYICHFTDFVCILAISTCVYFYCIEKLYFILNMFVVIFYYIVAYFHVYEYFLLKSF